MGAHAILDHVTIQLFPSQNRFEASICHNGEVEKLHTGQLGQLLPHLPGLNDLHAKGCNANFKLQVKGKVEDLSWFTKSTMNRFLQLVGSSDFLNASKAIEAEISQLEQASNLYAQPEGKTASSDSSKRELLHAMNLRMTALLNELEEALKQAAGGSLSSEEITHLAKFCNHFGAADLKNSLCKLSKMSQSGDMAVLQNDCNNSLTQMSRGDDYHQVAGEDEMSGHLCTVTPVKYGVSPALAAQVERQNSCEIEESSCSSEENDTLAEWGRALEVSIPPRRLASPMRRVQIARTKSHRTPALRIKSLGYHPGRETSSVSRDSAASIGEEEGYEQPPSEQVESNKRTMTVQDAISIFESKRKDQNEDDRKRSTLSSTSSHAVKPVLRRWSAGVTLSSSPSKTDLVLEDAAIHCPSSLPSNVETDGKMIVADSLVKQSVAENEHATQNLTTEPEVEVCAENEDNAVDFPTDNKSSKEHGTERLTVSSEWIRQKELEFNQMVKMMEHQDLKAQMHGARKQVAPSVQKGGLYNRYREKSNKKLQSDQAGKKAENGAKSVALKQKLQERKSGASSSKVKDHGKDVSSKKPHESTKNSFTSSGPGDDSLKASVLKKVSSKTSILLASRKSWPSMLPSATVKPSPSKFSPRNAESGTTLVCQKSLATPKLPIAKIERYNPRQRKMEETKTISNSKSKCVKEEKHAVKKGAKEPKGKLTVAAGDCSGIVPLKSSSYGKMKKKGSVVPVEGKPLIRKGSGAANGVSPTVDNTNQSHQPVKSATKQKNAVRTQENQVSGNASGPPNEIVQQVIGSESDGYSSLAAETEKLVERDQNCVETEKYNKLSNGVTADFSNVALSSSEVQSEEQSVIPPTAWVENEIDEQQDTHVLNNNITLQPPSLVHVATVGLPTSRVRHSLSEMLQEDDSDPDAPVWGNAENPPPLAYQRDAVKRLTGLLKISRNVKGDVNVTELSSLSTFLEGDDVNKIVDISKRNNVYPPGKEALHLYNRQQATMNAVESSAQPNFGRFKVQKGSKIHKDHVSSEVPKTKGRSFFSLSAFRNS